MLPQMPANMVVKSAINKILRRRKNLKMEILVGIISRHRKQEVNRTEEHRDSKEQHRHVFLFYRDTLHILLS